MSDGVRRLGLGTAQFGLAYGVTNTRGQVAHDEMAAILSLARGSGMAVIDTAHEYGESEAALGTFHDVTSGFRIITKTPSLGPERIDAEQVSSVRRALDNSRRTLRRDRLDGLMVHNGQALLLPGGDRIIALMQDAKDRGFVAAVGVSVFEPADLEAILAIFVPDLVQIPLNLLDQRFVGNGRIAALAAKGIEIHVRSVFLQGLLLAEPKSLPGSLAHARASLQAVRRFCEGSRFTAMEACLHFVLALSEIRHVIVGVTCADELAAIVAAAQERPRDRPDFASLAVDDLDIIAPARWRVPSVAWGNVGTVRSK